MKISQAINHGNKRWKVDFGVIGGRRRIQFFPTKAKAQAALNEVVQLRRTAGDYWRQIPVKKRAHLLAVIHEIEQAGLDIATVWETFKKEKLRPLSSSVTLAQAIDELLQAKRTANRRERYLKSLAEYLKLFARGREQMPVQRITTQDLEDWFNQRQEAITTRNSNIGRLSALFTLCVRRGYLAANPCDNLERPYLERRPPTILKPNEIEKVLAYTHQNYPQYLAWLALALLCGLRPEEADQTQWKDINFVEGKITVNASASKVRYRRTVSPLPMALAWLQEARKLKASLPLSHSTRRRFLRRLRAVLGYAKWPQDCLRHSAASYWTSKIKDVGRVAYELGTSADILGTHYLNLVTQAETDHVWSIQPPQSCHRKSGKTQRQPN